MESAKAAAVPQRLDRWVLWFGGLSFLTCYLGQTVLGVIQPTIASELDLSTSEAQWVVNSFFLTLALFAAPGGRLGDLRAPARTARGALDLRPRLALGCGLAGVRLADRLDRRCRDRRI